MNRRIIDFHQQFTEIHVFKKISRTRGRTRTGTPAKAADFESAASTIPPLGQRKGDLAPLCSAVNHQAAHNRNVLPMVRAMVGFLPSAWHNFSSAAGRLYTAV